MNKKQLEETISRAMGKYRNVFKWLANVEKTELDKELNKESSSLVYWRRNKGYE